MVGDTYTIVDMNVWGWARMMPIVLGEECLGEIPEPQASGRRDPARPGRRAMAAALKDKHKFKTEIDDEARKAMFRHLNEKVA